MNNVEKTNQINRLLDIYGRLLTKPQYEIMSDYYYCDLSLSEIAADYSISRQGVVFMIVIVIMSRVAQLNGVLLSQAVADLVSAAIGLLLYLGAIKKN